jgi:hypothetical protein
LAGFKFHLPSAARIANQIADSNPSQSAEPSYPGLSSSLLSDLALFAGPGQPAKYPTVGIASLDRPADLPNGDKTFDFAANIRLLRFRIPTAQ